VKLPRKKTKLQRVLASAGDALDSAQALGRSLSSVGSRNDIKAAIPDVARKAGLIAGGLVGVTAGSAGISSYRRRREGAGADS
jgi:hypothetical protein